MPKDEKPLQLFHQTTCQDMRIKIRRDKGPILSCSKSFGERCTLEGLPEGVVSPNAAKSASLVKNVPCRPLCEGYFHQTILNNSHEYTKMHRNPLPTTPFDFAITPSAGWCFPILPDITHQLPFGILEVFSGHTR